MRPLDGVVHLWISVCSLLILTSCEEQRIPEGESASRSSIADARLLGGVSECLPALSKLAFQQQRDAAAAVLPFTDSGCVDSTAS